MSYLERSRHPEHGWIFNDPRTGYKNDMPLGRTFDATVEHIMRHRAKNPALTAKHKLATGFDEVAEELERYTKKRLHIDDSLPKLVAPRGILRRAGAVVVGNIKQFGIGAQNLLAWSDSGRVVPKEVAESRALICTSGAPGEKRCPMNGTGDWKQAFTAPAAELIKNQLSAKNSMKLSTKYDQSLGVCEACACPLPLKVWTPLEFALRKMSKDTKEKLPEWCWMKIGEKK